MSDSFEAWLKRVDGYINEACGMDHRDLPDIDYRGLWECGETPIVAAHEALEMAGFDF